MAHFKFSILICLFLFPFALLFNKQAIAQKEAQNTHSVLIIDGQSNHKNWREGTQTMKKYLEETGIFSVDVATTPPAGESMENFKPKFANYKVILLNYNGAAWPEETEKDFENYVQNGGGVVIVHSANNSFPVWKEYNKMIGIGGWEGRDERSGPYVYYDESKGKVVHDPKPGPGGSHGPEHAFKVTIRNKKHPITNGLPEVWMHEKDELYDRLRGPAENMEILATAFSSKDMDGIGRHEPVLMVLTYGKGRIFHTALGHGNYSQKGIGFKTTIQRGAEWSATGQVTQKVPKEFSEVAVTGK
jgi:type 1 glutamine amidotransferase